ncbi:MAG: prepilin-type N-terminal cleavage/methylation domain-containing protein [Candidatus Moranbacteria bacterium]|nr:prepilin-type N-terminal cleavage/methylation domain-containing protein [Candidatus Moranbacteria bacterium]
MKQKFSKIKKGFSLVEMLIVAAIMIFMTGVLFVNQNGKKASSDVEVMARQIAAQIRALQNEALNGKRFDTNADGIADINACRFYFDAPAGLSYYVKYYSNCAVAPTEIVSAAQTVSLNKKRVSIVGSATNLFFSPPDGRVDGVKTIVIKSTIANVCASVNVSINGSVTEQKNVACP